MIKPIDPTVFLAAFRESGLDVGDVVGWAEANNTYELGFASGCDWVRIEHRPVPSPAVMDGTRYEIITAHEAMCIILHGLQGTLDAEWVRLERGPDGYRVLDRNVLWLCEDGVFRAAAAGHHVAVFLHRELAQLAGYVALQKEKK